MAKTARQIHKELTGSPMATSLLGGLLSGETRQVGQDDPVWGGGMLAASRRLRRQAVGSGRVSAANAAAQAEGLEATFAANMDRARIEQAAVDFMAEYPDADPAAVLAMVAELDGEDVDE